MVPVTTINIFESYSHQDQKLVDALRAELIPRLSIAKDVQFYHWSDREVELGTDWDQEIMQALVSYQTGTAAGLLYLSPHFFASDYIVGKELPVLLAQYPLLYPVMLSRVDPEFQDLKGVETRQWFSFKGKSFAECRQKRQFTHELSLAIQKRTLQYLQAESV